MSTAEAIAVTVGLKPPTHPFFNEGSKYCYFLNELPGVTLTLTPGAEYIFDINTPGHPFYFTLSEQGGSEDKDPLPGFDPTEKGTVSFVMPDDYPPDFYYQCKIHAYMGGKVKKNEEPEMAKHHTLTLTPVLQGLAAPTSLTTPRGDTDNIYVADQIGIVYKYNLKTQEVTEFLNVTQWIPKLDPYYDERGLLGLCFHPGFPQNGRFYIYYSSIREQASGYYNCLSEFTYKDGKILYEAEKVILRLIKDLNFHNGGKIGFGPDGYLYITVGDAGPQRDTYGHAQDLGNWFGKILRIDVNVEAYPYYRVPQDNPFIDVKGAKPEIWAYGFRNPWGLEFLGNYLIVTDAGLDPPTGKEEVNIVVKGGNYGWNVKEGPNLAPWAKPGTDTSKMIDPIFSYTTKDSTYADSDQSVIVGGYLTAAGDYICADYSGRLIRLRFKNNGGAEVVETSKTGKSIRSFGKTGESLTPRRQVRDIQLYVLTSEQSGPRGTTGEVHALTVS